MKNKNITYILFTVVLLVWGVIFYRLFVTFLSSKNNTIQHTTSNIHPSKPIYQPPDTFRIVGHYRDPFLGTSFNSVRQEKPVMASGKKNPKKKEESMLPADYSFIRYLGNIKNKQNSKKLALVTIHNQEYITTEGEIIQGVKFIKNYSDSILISYNGRTVCIKK